MKITEQIKELNPKREDMPGIIKNGQKLEIKKTRGYQIMSPDLYSKNQTIYSNNICLLQKPNEKNAEM